METFQRALIKLKGSKARNVSVNRDLDLLGDLLLSWFSIYYGTPASLISLIDGILGLSDKIFLFYYYYYS